MPSRNDLLLHLISEINNQPWQLFYKKKSVGILVSGWPKRLEHFTLSNSKNPSLKQHLQWLYSLQGLVNSYNPSQPATIQCGLDLGKQILEWGGVTRGNVSKLSKVLDSVVESTRQGKRISNAPMNSGWTKISAVFNYHDTNQHTNFGSHPAQVIWDSRVSLSVCCRLVDAAKHNRLTPSQLTSLFPDLGWVPGRGGNRPSLQMKASDWFRNRYGSWEAHFAGGKVVYEIAELLNAKMNANNYGLDFTSTINGHDYYVNSWTPWLVACVLFMDGQ
ncbi:MAG: hypothetical protein WCS94_11515 [Verrucomicrobiota bacterium]